MKATEFISYVQNGGFDSTLIHFYGEAKLAHQRVRFAEAAKEFVSLYGDSDISIFSVPGRSEISGNHTDHNHGCVLAAALDLDIIAIATKVDAMTVTVKSKGFPEDKVDVTNLDPDSYGNYGSAALIAGICDGFAKRGLKYGGFTAYTTSDVLKGSGISSSAAFEVQICNIINHFYNGGAVDAPELAKISQYAENVFFGKPCGLMDQTACAVGGFVAIDFADPTAPVIEKLDFSLEKNGYCLCIVNTGGNHADLNDDYASVPAEMKSVAACFGLPVLRGITYDQLLAKLPELRESVGDRALMRALHFVEENDRVAAQKTALKSGDLPAFLSGVLASGDSSFKQLQNVYTVKNVSEQGLSLALALCKHLLDGKGGAWRVHGGGFAGTVQAFVPLALRDEFKKVMDGAFGENACSVLNIRAEGAVKVELA
ncbi:MAG: galactokinase [Clostridia bacterium]|nr:galactokinase [Clostridia bacterium]